MIQGFQKAQGEIASAVALDLPLFAPPERQQFLGEAILSAFAGLLLSAFLAGVKEAAEEKAIQTGKQMTEYLWGAIADLFSDKKESTARKELDKRAKEAPGIAKGLSEEALARTLARVEVELKAALKTKMPTRQAEQLATRVRESTLKHILRK